MHEFSVIARAYEPKNRKQFNLLLESAANVLRALQDNPEMIRFYAGIACGLSVGIRLQTGIDLCKVSFPPESLPIPSSDPVSKTFPILNHIIKSHLEWLGNADSEQLGFADVVAKFHTSLVWKAYVLFALNSEPSKWGTEALHAMNSLRILSTAGPTEVFDMNKKAKDEGIRKALQQDDWPPRGYMQLYFANREVLVYKNKMLLGIDFPPSFR